MKTKSFTLIELLVVIVIIGILAGVIIVSTSSSINKANFAKAQAFSNTVQQELLLNLVSEWTFDNESKLGEDTWGNNDGTVYGSPVVGTKEECVHGTCLIFDGTDDYIDCGPSNKLTPQYLSISAWFKTSSSGQQSIITKDGSFILRKAASNQLQFVVWIDGTHRYSSASYNAVNDDYWHFTILTYDGENIRLYFDGKEQGSGNFYSGTAMSSTGSVLIGKRTSTPELWLGLIDDVRIYNTALSTSQIKQEYIAGLNSLLANNNISKEEYDQRLNSLSSK